MHQEVEDEERVVSFLDCISCDAWMGQFEIDGFDHHFFVFIEAEFESDADFQLDAVIDQTLLLLS